MAMAARIGHDDHGWIGARKRISESSVAIMVSIIDAYRSRDRYCLSGFGKASGIKQPALAPGIEHLGSANQVYSNRITTRSPRFVDAVIGRYNAEGNRPIAVATKLRCNAQVIRPGATGVG